MTFGGTVVPERTEKIVQTIPHEEMMQLGYYALVDARVHYCKEVSEESHHILLTLTRPNGCVEDLEICSSGVNDRSTDARKTIHTPLMRIVACCARR